jgi:hypothetical protein
MDSKKDIIELTDAFMVEEVDEPSINEDEKLTPAQILIQLTAQAPLFHTPDGQAFAEVPNGDHLETFTIRGKQFRSWLVRKFYRKCSKPPSSQALQDAIAVLEAQALFASPEVPLFVRIGHYQGRIYIDLCNATREVIEISADGWKVLASSAVHFRRPKGMLRLPRPERGGSIAMLRKFINIGDDTNWILCAAWLAFVCSAKGPYPVLIIQGEQGSAKSTMEKLLRMIIDPSIALVRTPPKDDRDLLIAANNSWLVAYDNLSGIQPWLSDALCRLATGSGFSTRELFTDAEEVFFSAARPVILNGIDHLAERADLADRALILNLPSIEENNRKDEAHLHAEFERELPKILGALFTAVSCALRRLPETTLKRLPRMADFALFATAAEEGLDFEPGAFMRAYLGNRSETIQETLEGDPVGAAVMAMLDKLREQGDEEQWSGTCTDLRERFEQFVDDGTKKRRDWPKDPRSISSRLRRLATFLRASGIDVTFHPRATKGRRSLTISRMSGVSSATCATSAAADSAPKQDQSDSTVNKGGAGVAGVAVSSPPTVDAAPKPPSANALNNNRNPSGVAGVAEVAQISPTNLGGHPPEILEGICERCGPVHWQRTGGLWVCANCGEPAPGQEVERFEL